jgi:hypothetical protein
MQKRIRKTAIVMALAAAALGLGVAQHASAANPATFIQVYPSHILRQANLNLKSVTFYVDVLSDRVGVDVQSATINTQFNIQALVKCTGQDGTTIDENGDSPITAVDDALVFCPFFSRGEAIQGGVGILGAN